jgi:hypothetical protein
MEISFSMIPLLRLRRRHHHWHRHYLFRYTYHQAIDERRDYHHLHKYIRAGCARRPGGGILYLRAQLLVPLLYLLRSTLARSS